MSAADFTFDGLPVEDYAGNEGRASRERRAVAHLLADILIELRSTAWRTTSIWQTQPIAAGTVIELDLEPVRAGYCWEIERVAYATTSVSATDATMYLDTVDPINAVDVSPAGLGNRSVTVHVKPIYVPDGSRLVVNWTGATAPAAGKVRLQYRMRPLYVDRDLPPLVRDLLEGRR